MEYILGVDGGNTKTDYYLFPCFFCLLARMENQELL